MTPLFQFDSLAVISLALFACLTAVTLAASPRRDREGRQMAAFACIAFGTALAYVAGSLPMFAVGWSITVIPFVAGWLGAGSGAALSVGAVSLLAGSALSFGSGPAAQWAAFLFLVLAALLRKGIFPLHSWVLRGFERGSVLHLGLLLNGHLGAFLIVRFVIPRFPDIAVRALPFLSLLALLTALYAALMALSQNAPRRILALLTVSQASFLLAGLESRNTAGIAGALVHWLVVALATTGLYIVYRAVEARYSPAAEGGAFLGLVSHTPRLAVFFAVCGLALVGLPGTLGFAAEDLLFHGSLESHPLVGVTLPLATALNAITVYRLFSRLFLGKPASAVPWVPDALPRERWALTMAAAFLVVGGIAPGIWVTLRTPAAEGIAALLER